MWDKKRTEPTGPAPYTPAAAPPQAAATIPPVRVSEPPRSGSEIGAAISIIGDIYSEEDLMIHGEVKGALELKESRLTVGPRGKARSKIKAREVLILGEVHGDVEASHKITIRKDGSLVGNIKTTGIIIDDDAYFKGSIDIVRKPAS